MNALNQYLLHTLNERPEWMLTLEMYAKENHVPIMEPVSMNYVAQLVRMKKPKKILEIGTAIGYSSLRMLDASAQSTIMTIEKNELMYKQACENIRQLDKDNHITVLLGDAIERIKELYEQKDTFDFIFIDAAKGKYKDFFELVQPLTNEQTVIVCDNILFKGYVADEGKSENKRLQKLANKIRLFNEWLMKQEAYHTSIVPIGDGLTISVKK